jgi:ribosomal protein S17E
VTRVFPTLTALAVTAPLLTYSSSIQAQPTRDEPAPSGGFAANHWEAIVMVGTLVAAGIGGGILLWKRRKDLPADGVTRTPAQLRSYRDMLAFEQVLDAVERKPRAAAVAGLLSLIPSLVPADRKRTLQRLANQFCVEWGWLMKDETVERLMRAKVIRWPKVIRSEIAGYINRRMNDPQASVRSNAAAAFKWFQDK